MILLDDAQNGFRANRRSTDNVLLLNNTIKMQSKNKQGVYVIIVDFSKAFDRCHIPTLISKLSKYGIKATLSES